MGCKNIDFPKVAEKKWNMLYRIARSFHGGNTHDAEDAVQDAMYQLYKNQSKNGKCFENYKHVKNWLIRVTVNSCKRKLRDFWGGEKRIPIENVSEIAVWDDAEQSDLYTAFMSLPEQHKTVLYMYYYEGYTTGEIAGMIGQNEAHIRMRMSRARRKFKEALRDE